MALKELTIGSHGPFEYDDADFPAAIDTTGIVRAAGTPAAPTDLARLQDVSSSAESVWPVGSVFLSVVSTNPATLIGFGTWVQIAQGQLLAGYLNADPDFGTVEGTGGAKTASHDNNHAGTAVDSHATWTHSTAGAHTHDAHTTVAYEENTNAGTTVTGPATHSSDGGHTHDAHPAMTHTVTQPTAHSDHSILPPYFTVYVWKRTA